MPQKSAPMGTTLTITAPMMSSADEENADSTHLMKIEEGRTTAGLTNPDDCSNDLINVMATIRIKEPQIADSKMITDSMTTRNGNRMGSGSGRPLPSTHLGEAVDH